MQTKATPLDERRRRAAYRAAHRGTKEMDWLLGRYADNQLPVMTDAELDAFERLLELPDPELQVVLMNSTQHATGEHAQLLERIRSFHGITAAKN